MSEVQIGWHNRGFPQEIFPNRIMANGPIQSDLGYDAAVNSARQHAGAELIVPKSSGNTFRYDVYAVTIQDTGIPENKKLAGEEKAISFVDNTPSLFKADTGTLLNEIDQMSLLTLKGKDSALGVAAQVIRHARFRDIEGAQGLNSHVKDGQVNGTLSSLLSQLRNEKPALEELERKLKLALATAERILSEKAAPYERAIEEAEANFSKQKKYHQTNVAQKTYDLEEARRPGIHQAEAEVTKRQGELKKAEQAVDKIERKLEEIEKKFRQADELMVEYRVKSDRLLRVEQKLQDYDRGMEFHRQYGKYPPGWSSGGTPPSWSSNDTLYNLKNDRDYLKDRLTRIQVEEMNLRRQAEREERSARDELRFADRDLRDAKDRLDRAEEYLRRLPAGDPQSIRQAEQALEKASNEQKKALDDANRRIDDAEQALERNTVKERQAVVDVKRQLADAPRLYDRMIDDTARKLGLS